MKKQHIPGAATRRLPSAGRRGLAGLSAVGLVLLVSAGLCSRDAGALTFIYTYTVEANTCTVETTGADTSATIPATGGNAPVDVRWGEITKDQLTDNAKRNKKSFGITLHCQGDIFEPTLSVDPVAAGGYTVTTGGSYYVAADLTAVAGFAIEPAEDTSTGEKTALESALSSPGSKLLLPETGPTPGAASDRTIKLTAWPAIMPQKDIKDLKPGDPIQGAVTLNVSYN
ncbi:hypothetical protein RJV04_005062 [Salmonella enterica]|nr:hypothetical protein [Salmonella enterica]